MQAHHHRAARLIQFLKELASHVMPKGSSPVAGSSRSNKDGRWIRARAMAGNPLPHTAGKSANQRVTPLEESNFPQQFFGSRSGLLDILQLGEQHQIFFRREFVVHHRRVRHVARPAVAIGSAVEAAASTQETHVPCPVGRTICERHPKQGGLSGTIASRKDDAFARSNLKGHSPQCVKPTIALSIFSKRRPVGGSFNAVTIEFRKYLKGAPSFAVSSKRAGSAESNATDSRHFSDLALGTPIYRLSYPRTKSRSVFSICARSRA